MGPLKYLNYESKRFVLFCAFLFLVPCFDVRSDFRIKTMFDSSLPPVVCRRSYLCFFLCRCVYWFSTRFVYMSFTTVVLLEAGTAYSLTAPALTRGLFLVGPVLFIFLVFCVVSCRPFSLCCLRRVSFGCPMLPPVSLDCQFLIALQFSLTFIEWSKS